MTSEAYVLPFDHLRTQDVPVWEASASLGEMISQCLHWGARAGGSPPPPQPFGIPS
jgi:hypothetical protein